MLSVKVWMNDSCMLDANFLGVAVFLLEVESILSGVICISSDVFLSLQVDIGTMIGESKFEKYEGKFMDDDLL